MRLDRLLDGVGVLEIAGDPSAVDVRAVTHDSRRVTPGTLFCCVPGARADGHDFAARAVEAGAGALLCERLQDVGGRVVQVRVAEVRPAMAEVAAAFHGRPSEHLDVVGVTGTNGKTTVTHMLASILEAAGRRPAVIGTLSGARTTPEAPDLQEQLAGHRAGGVDAVAMEVSSHALVQHRVDAVHFAAGVFTNLSHDHLDFHGTMEDYFRAKASLFVPGRCRAAVVNVSDPWGRRLADSCPVPVHPYREEDAGPVTTSLDRARFRWRGREVDLPVGGRINVMNALAAATAASILGVGDPAVVAGLAATPPVPGRMEVVPSGRPFSVVVDYAHTPDGLTRVLEAVRRACPGGRVAVVFGCGGGRDPRKRPAMGRAAAEGADFVVVTSDNPRDEDPAVIISEVLAGIDPAPRDLVVEPDRRAAISRGLEWAEAGDVVVVAGKGHETGQEIAGTVLPFDDRSVVRELLGVAVPGAEGARR